MSLTKSLYQLFNKPEIKLDPQCFPLRNRTLKFIGTDTERLWKKNRDNPRLSYYLDHEITYQLNNFGYRTPYNFKRGDKVDIFLGCSHTIGYGIEFEKTWPYLVNLETKNNLVNLAVGGCSIDRQFRELYTWFNYFDIQNIFHYQPIYAREEFISEKSFIKLSVQDPPKEVSNSIEDKFLVEYFGSDVHVYKKYITNILAIESLSNRLGVNYYFLNNSLENSLNGIPARDDMHLDVEGHKTLSTIFLDKYKKQDTSIELIEQDFSLIDSPSLI